MFDNADKQCDNFQMSKVQPQGVAKFSLALLVKVLLIQKSVIGNIKNKETFLKYLEVAQTFYVEHSPGEIIIAHFLLITPESESTISDLSVSVLTL